MPPISDLRRTTAKSTKVTHLQSVQQTSIVPLYEDNDNTFPFFHEFRVAFLLRRKKALHKCIALVDEVYLPGLKKRLIKWLRTTIDLQYEEDMWSECFRDISLHNDVIEHITKSVRRWFEDGGYKTSIIYVSSTRFLLKIKLGEYDIDPKVSTTPTNDTVDDTMSVSSSMVDLGDYDRNDRYDSRPLLSSSRYRVPAMTRLRWICPL